MIARFDAWLRPEVPEERFRRVRVLVGLFALVYLVARLPYFADLSRHGASDFAPVGVARVLSSPLSTGATTAVAVVAVVLGAGLVLGVRVRATAPAFFLAMLWVTTYRSSFGKILHSENLLVLHLGVLALAELAVTPGRRRAGWALRTMGLLTVLVYVVAGVSKLRFGGAAWVSGAALGDWAAWDALRKIELGSLHSPLAAWVAGSAGLVRVLAIVTLIVELGAPVALIGGRAARVWCAAAWLFHLGVLVTMAIGFFYPLAWVAFAPLLRPETWRWPFASSSASEGDAER